MEPLQQRPALWFPRHQIEDEAIGAPDGDLIEGVDPIQGGRDRIALVVQQLAQDGADGTFRPLGVLPGRLPSRLRGRS